MYAPLLILIIALVCLIPAVLWLVLPYRLYRRYEAKCYYTTSDGQSTRFYGGGSTERKLIEAGREKEVKRLKKYNRKRDFWYKLWGSFELTKSVVITVIIALIFVFGLVSIVGPLEALDEANYWKEFEPMAQQVIESAEPMQTVAIAGEVIEYNKWLAEARASQETFGCWSSYYFIDLSSLEYITL